MIEPADMAGPDAWLDGMFSLGSQHDVLCFIPAESSAVHFVRRVLRESFGSMPSCRIGKVGVSAVSVSRWANGTPRPTSPCAFAYNYARIRRLVRLGPRR